MRERQRPDAHPRRDDSSPGQRRHRVTSRASPRKPVRPQVEQHLVSELCQIPSETPAEQRVLGGHSKTHRCCGKSLRESALVRVGVGQHARPESISKRAPSTTRTSLRASGINSLPAGGDPRHWQAGHEEIGTFEHACDSLSHAGPSKPRAARLVAKIAGRGVSSPCFGSCSCFLAGMTSETKTVVPLDNRECRMLPRFGRQIGNIGLMARRSPASGCIKRRSGIDVRPTE